MAKQHTFGSALLLVMLFLSLLLMLGAGIWHKMGFLIDLNGTLYQQEKKYHATVAALYWAIALYKEHSTQLKNYLNLHETLAFSLDNWLDEKGCKALIEISTLDPDVIKISAYLKKDTSCFSEVACCVRSRYDAKKKRTVLYLFNWHQKPHRI